MPNVTVTATNVDTAIVTTTTTNASGDYLFQNLAIGIYTIGVSVQGFMRYEATGIVLHIDQNWVQPVRLAVGSSVESVEVQANSIQVNTTDMQLSHVIDTHQIMELPLIARNFTGFTLILPGVQAANDRFTTNYSANGSQSQQTSYLINGADSNDLPLNTVVFQPNIDALQEFNLITGASQR
jgi:Carboxypeptidase regulatory-like domain